MEKKLFDNIGKTIKKLARILFYFTLICGAIVTVVAFLYYVVNKKNIEWLDNPYAYGELDDLIALGKNAIVAKSVSLYGLIMTIVGPLSCLPLYGFGQLVEDVHDMKNRSGGQEPSVSIDDLPEL